MRSLRIVTLLCVLVMGVAHGQGWPTRPVKLLVPFPPGGATDVCARALSDHLAQALGQAVIVENRGGASGAVGTAEAAHANPDGYTILFGANAITLLHLATKNLPYDTLRDFVAVTQVSTQPNAIAVNPALPVNSIKELIAYAKANPGKLSYAHPGEGSSQHLTAELLWKLAGVSLVGVPYRGGGQAIKDLLGGHVQVAVLGSTPLIPQYHAGRIRILAFTSKERFPQMPEIPTLADAGFPQFDSTQWLGLLAPRGTSPDIVRRLYVETAKVLALPDVKVQLGNAAMEPVGSTPEQFSAVIRTEIEHWGKVARELGIQPQ